MTTEGNDPNAGNEGAEGASKLDPALVNKLFATFRAQNKKEIEGLTKPFIDKISALEAELAELKGKGAAGQESGGKPSGKTEAELQIEAMRRKVDELTADNERTKREAQEQRVKNALFAEANGKVRKDMAENFVMLAQSRVKTASDGTLSLDIDGQSYDVKTGVETLLKSNSFAGFNQPVQPPNRSAKDPANGANSFNLQSVDVEKISGSELGERLLKPTA
jgi:molybdopterin converting factor small subunit